MSAERPWTVIVPVKTLAAAKSRLGENGPLLARAFLIDTLAATRACPQVAQVVVATADPTVASDARLAGCTVVDDSGRPGINAAAAWAAEQVGIGGPCAVLVSDLPCLTPEGLSTVLQAAARLPRSFVSDATGEGTTMWLVAPGEVVSPSFGPDSAAAHRAAQAVDLVGTGLLKPEEVAVARRDVDTQDDLRLARDLGLGPASREAVALVQPA